MWKSEFKTCQYICILEKNTQERKVWSSLCTFHSFNSWITLGFALHLTTTTTVDRFTFFENEVTLRAVAKSLYFCVDRGFQLHFDCICKPSKKQRPKLSKTNKTEKQGPQAHWYSRVERDENTIKRVQLSMQLYLHSCVDKANWFNCYRSKLIFEYFSFFSNKKMGLNPVRFSEIAWVWHGLKFHVFQNFRDFVPF